MSGYEDDEDEFLYGNDDVPNPKRQKTSTVVDLDENITDGKDQSYSPEPAVAEPVPSVSTTITAGEGKDDDDDNDDEDEYEDDDEESDIEFVIDTKPGQKAEAPSKHAPYSTGKSTTTTTTEGAADTTTTATTKESQKTEKPTGIDIDAVAEHNGKPLTEISLQELEDKPWRKPGADVTDYFNYGFDEFTWTAYCSKQDNLRDTFTPQKVMAMMGMPVFPDMMAFPPQGFPGMPPNMQGQLPPPGFMGMPQNNDDSGAYGNSNIVTGGNNYRRK